jgi:hypothetical protein
LLHVTCPHRQNSRHRAGHPSSACTTSMSTCPAVVVSCHIGGGALWCSIVVARCSAATRRCSSQDARAKSSTMRSRVGCLMPPCPILSLLVDDYGLYRHLTSTALSPFRCSAVPSLRGRDARARISTVMSRTAPLLHPSLLTPHAAHLASSSLAPSHIGTLR